MMPSLMDNVSHGEALFDYCEKRKTGRAYYYDCDLLVDRLAAIKSALPECFTVLFSIKANPSPRLLRYLSSARLCGADVSSGLELKAARSNGFDAADICYVGPGKSIPELSLACDMQIGAITVESQFELDVLDHLGMQIDRAIPVLLRINPEYEVRGVRMAMGGRPTQFGIGEEEATNILVKEADRYPHLSFDGIHVYVGTRILRAEDAVWNIRQVLELVRSLAKRGFRCRKADVGGGLGIPYYVGEEPLQFDEFASQIHEHMSAYPSELKDGCRLYLESGRFVVGPSGCFIAKVTDVWHSGSDQCVEIDATPALHALSEGSILTRNQRYMAAGLNRDGWVAGNVSTIPWYRINGRRHRWPSVVQAASLAAGDYLVFLNSGAYGPSTSPVWKNLEGFPCELAGKGGEIFEIKPQMTWRDLARGQMLFAADPDPAIFSDAKAADGSPRSDCSTMSGKEGDR